MAKEHIERDPLVAWIEKQKRLSKPLVIMAIQEIPAADVVEVVRCGECKYSFQDRITDNLLCNRKMLGLVRQEDFCSFGERRVSDAED